MQITFQDLNPYLYYQPLHAQPEPIDLFKRQCIEELQQSCGIHENSIKEVADGTLPSGQIRINGEIKTVRHWTFDEETVPQALETYMQYHKAGSILAYGLTFLGIPLSYFLSTLMPASVFLTVPVLVALAAAGIFLVYVKLPSMMEEMKDQSILDAQDYLMGPYARGREHVLSTFNARYNNEQMRFNSLALEDNGERARIMQRQAELSDTKNLELYKYFAIHTAFREIRDTNHEKGTQVVIKIFKGTFDPEVLEFQQMAQQKFDEFCRDRTLILS